MNSGPLHNTQLSLLVTSTDDQTVILAMEQYFLYTDPSKLRG